MAKFWSVTFTAVARFGSGGERRERRGRDRRHRPHAAAAVHQARGHDGRSRALSDRLCARARIGRGAHGRTSFHAGTSRRLDKRGVERTAITLHVGYGTFQPVRVDQVEAHAIDAEHFSISEAAADAINRARREKRRVIAVGTTTTRALEAAGRADGAHHAAVGLDRSVHLPRLPVQIVDGLMTNFHLPESSLLMLVVRVRRPRCRARGLSRGGRREVQVLQLRRRHADSLNSQFGGSQFADP